MALPWAEVWNWPWRPISALPATMPKWGSRKSPGCHSGLWRTSGAPIGPEKGHALELIMTAGWSMPNRLCKLVWWTMLLHRGVAPLARKLAQKNSNLRGHCCCHWSRKCRLWGWWKWFRCRDYRFRQMLWYSRFCGGYPSLSGKENQISQESNRTYSIIYWIIPLYFLSLKDLNLSKHAFPTHQRAVVAQKTGSQQIFEHRHDTLDEYLNFCEVEGETADTNKTKVHRGIPEDFCKQGRVPTFGMGYSANHIKGCEHGCVYCYARNSHEYWGYGAGLDFERNILVKKTRPNCWRNPAAQGIGRGYHRVFGNTDCLTHRTETGNHARVLKTHVQWKNPRASSLKMPWS